MKGYDLQEKVKYRRLIILIGSWFVRDKWYNTNVIIHYTEGLTCLSLEFILNNIMFKYM